MKTPTKRIIWIGPGVLILLALFAFFVFSGKSGESQKTLDSPEEIVTMALSEISGQAKWYEYQSENINIKYFIVTSEDNSIKSAFDACDVCYGSKKGYSQEGDFMVCNNCGNRYPISGLGTENKPGGGCWPGYLPSRVEGDNLVIKTSDLKQGGYRFK
jgi:uncharacterized membrane protein